MLTVLMVALALLLLAAAPLPALLKRIAGLDPTLTALGAAFAALLLALALLPAALSGAPPLAHWQWVPALGLSVALRADVLAVGLALALTAGSAFATAAARRRPRHRDLTQHHGRALALTGAMLGAVLAEDLALLWLCLELATLVSVLFVAGDGREPPRRRGAIVAFVVMEAGGLALLAGMLLIADVAGSFRVSAVLAASAELRAHPLYLPMAGLVLLGAATRLAPWLSSAERRGVALPAGAALVAAALVPLRLAPALGGTRTWIALLAALGAGLALLLARRTWRGRRPGPARAAVSGPPLLEELALAARIVWQPLLAPRPALSLAALGTGAALAATLAAGGVRPDAWPAPLSPAWAIAAGSSWLLLAVAACVARARVARALGLVAAAALLLLAWFAPPAVVGAEVVAGAAALWRVSRGPGARWPPRPALLALGACLATAVGLRALLGGPPVAPGGEVVGHGAAAAGSALLAPLALPLVAAVALFALGGASPALKRALAAVALVANLALAAGLLHLADGGAALGLALGVGPVPFGVHLLLDRLAAVMLLIGATVAVLVFGATLGRGAQRRHRHFHALCQLQLCGLAGTVLAADLLDLFVFLELLLASFNVLLAEDSAGAPTAASSHVAVVGAAGSGLFLIAAGCAYAALGTFGFAELAVRAPAVAAGESPLLRVGAYLLLVVLALRAAALPFGFWLARACESAPAAAALVVLPAESGVYAILRICALVLPCFGVGPCGPSALVLPLGLATLTGGGIGALAAAAPGELRAPLLAIALGTLLVGVGSFRETGFAAALYLFAPAAIGAVALALVSDPAGGAPSARGALGAATLLAAAGLAPFAAWIGRIGILAAAGPDALVVWSLVLAGGLIATTAAARAASLLYWHARPAAPRGHPAGSAVAGVALGLLAAIALAAGPLYGLAGRSARQILDRQAYITALRGVDEGPAQR